MMPDDQPATVVQDELAAFVTSLGVEAVRTAETYDSLVRATQDRAVQVPTSRDDTDAADTMATSSPG
ncbi:hypothetical protein BL253_32835 [Pseudofrankia asymbiotica]|uniref:Uncharacterized protein n=2 Tax=Pseudofrankia asymbiotica TaxID=1834516 RepID=A0A1V2I261_9ACTN|nr:hypothetical protein BL253_32835 [Pseudofrankia asymbiotica]